MSLLALSFFDELFEPSGGANSIWIFPLALLLRTRRHGVQLCGGLLRGLSLLSLSQLRFKSGRYGIRNGVYHLFLVDTAGRERPSTVR